MFVVGEVGGHDAADGNREVESVEDARCRLRAIDKIHAERAGQLTQGNAERA